MSPTAVAEPPVAASPFQMLARVLMKPSPLNPRKHFDTVKLQELAASMGHGVGIIEPVVVRPVTDDRGVPFELVAGERRWRAAALAGLDEVPAIVKPLTDAQVLEIMVIENDQREDINPLEEGDGFKRLMKFGFEIDKLASRIGRTRKYIYDRVKLLELIPAAKTLLLDERITAGHAILIARLTKEQQARILEVETKRWDDRHSPLFVHENALRTDEEREALQAAQKTDPYAGMKTRSVRELEAYIDQHVRFDPSTPVNVELFPATKHVVEEAKKVIAITHNHHVDPDAKEGLGSQRIYSVVSWRRADGQGKSKICERSVTGVFVVGPGRGEALEVCVNKDCDVHWGKEKRAKAKAAASPAAQSSYEKKQQAEEARRHREDELRKGRARAWDLALPEVLAAVAAKVFTIPITKVIADLRAEAHQPALARAVKLLGGTAATPGPDGMLRVLLLVDLLGDTSSWNADRFMKRTKAVLGVDAAAIVNRVTASAQPKTPAKARARKKR